MDRKCQTCARPVARPRLGQCSACYQRDRRGHVPGEACDVCELADRRVLRRHELGGQWHTLCGNCAAIAGRRVLELEELAAEIRPASDRRRGDRRRSDRREPLERRQRFDAAAELTSSRRGERRAS